MKKLILILTLCVMMLMPFTANANPDGPVGSSWVSADLGFGRTSSNSIDLYSAEFHESTSLYKISYGLVFSETYTFETSLNYSKDGLGVSYWPEGQATVKKSFMLTLSATYYF